MGAPTEVRGQRSEVRKAVLAALVALTASGIGTAQAQSRPQARPQPQPRASRPRSTAPPIPGPERVRLQFNGGVQLFLPGSFGQQFTLTRNVEPAPVSTELSLRAGVSLDGGARVRVTRTFSVGAVGFIASSSASGTLDAQVPHPFYFGQPRAVSGDLSHLSHLERGVHLEVAYPVSITRGREITIVGGPSVINARQELPTDLRYVESYPYDTASFSGPILTTVSKTVVGAHAGVDATWRLSRSLRAGVLVRYTFAPLSLTAATGNTVDMHAGGLQVAGSLRILLQKRPPRPARPAPPARPRR